ncbi:hypothetical protein ACH5RR_011458 [Cinchona calisaya]|uniref:RRM domain-containing protein n=1 Tax=Cinchona calisaya TaxID=153742 RepID=A0ABD3A8J7_9GENT
MAAYYPPAAPPPNQYQYYEPPPPPGAAHPPPPAVAQPLHHQQFLPPQPQFVTYAAPPLYPQSSHDEVRTLFIAGLPEDVKAREIYNLFREFPGYESSHLRTTASTQPFAFAVFVDQQSAVMALHALNGMVFDLEKDSTLYIDLAKSNPRSKRLRTDDESTGSGKRMKSSTFSKGKNSGVGSIHMPGMGNSAHNTIGFPSTRSHGSFDGGAASDSSTKLNTIPCPTLFVANLGPTCSEQELIQVFSRCRGFLKLKMQSTYGAPVAFVDFEDADTSTEALNHLQGTVLYSSPSGEGMRLEYAKSRMGLRSKKSR